MNLIEKIREIERLDQLIRLKATGPPKKLAGRLDVSERKLFRIINEMKNMGLPIDYCKGRRTYIYTESVKIRFELIVQDEKILAIKGGNLTF